MNLDANNNNPFRFGGMYWDWETQTYMTPNRNLNPRTGRWTSPDPFWNIRNMQSSNAARLQSGNLYMFVMHNPVRYVDPSGLMAAHPRAIGGGLTWAVTIIQQVREMLTSEVHEIIEDGGSFRPPPPPPSPTIYLRNDWRALPATFPSFTQGVTRIVMHHTVTDPTRLDPRYGRQTVAEMVRWIDDLHHGWGNRGVGYHFLIGYDGSIFQGRPMDVEGRHAMRGYRVNRNPFTIGVALIGDFSGDNSPAQAQLDSLFWLTDHILDTIPTINTIECHWFSYFGPWYIEVQNDLRRRLR